MSTEYSSTWSDPRPDGARAEFATIVHERRECTSYGAIIDHARGLVVGYVRANELVSWQGDVIGYLRVVGHARTRWSDTYGGFLTCYQARVDGRGYHGRGAGDGMMLRLRADKNQKTRMCCYRTEYHTHARAEV